MSMLCRLPEGESKTRTQKRPGCLRAMIGKESVVYLNQEDGGDVRGAFWLDVRGGSAELSVSVWAERYQAIVRSSPSAELS
jgi:hypothetical protein